MRNLITLFTLILPLFAFAKVDSLIVYDDTDTVWIDITPLQEKAFTHTVEPGQTLYAIAKFYGLSVVELFYYNPDLESQSISIGQIINIPMPTTAVIRRRGKQFKADKCVLVMYRVKKSETLYRIAKQYFKIPLDTLIARNQLANPTLSVGQALHIGWMRKEGISEKHRKFRGQPIDKRNQLLASRYYQAKEVKRERKEDGVAFWQDTGVKSVALYALHRSAPLNSIIAVTNPMSQRTVYAKVIGTIPDTIYDRDVVAVISARVAKLLGVKDQRAYIKLRYLK